jgi:hypothetical protein
MNSPKDDPENSGAAPELRPVTEPEAAPEPRASAPDPKAPLPQSGEPPEFQSDELLEMAAMPYDGLPLPPPIVDGTPPILVIHPPPPPPPPPPTAGVLLRLLAGVETGIIGGVIMMLWFALDSLFEQQYWWAMLNLWGAAVYGNRVFSMGLGMATLTGAALHLFLHGTGGALWSLLAGRLTHFWLHLAGSIGAAAVWYFVLHHWFWPAVAPAVSRMTPMPATALAYLLFGAALSRGARRVRELAATWRT